MKNQTKFVACSLLLLSNAFALSSNAEGATSSTSDRNSRSWKLVCVDPTQSDTGYVAEFDMTLNGPRSAVVKQLHRSGTIAISENDSCSALDKTTPHSPDAVVPEFQCVDPQVSDGGAVVELSTGDKTGTRFARIYSVDRSGTRPLANDLRCYEASE